MFERYTEKARRVIFFARYEASQFGQPYIETEHLLMGILREDKALTNRFLRSHASVESIRKQIEEHTVTREKVSTSVDLPLSNESKRVLAYAAEEAESLGHKHIGSEHLLLGLLREEQCFAAELLKERGVKLESLREELARVTGTSPRPIPSEAAPVKEFFKDLTQEAVNGNLEPIVGRGPEVDAVIEVLAASKNRNPILVGERGAGKKSIVEALAQRVANAAGPPFLTEKRILFFDPQSLTISARDRIQLANQLNENLSSLIGAGSSILFFRELRTSFARASVFPSFADILRPALSEGKIQCIAACTLKEYKEFGQTNQWIDDLFRAVYVRPLGEEGAISAVKTHKLQYERFHEVGFDDEALASAVKFADRYLPDRALPGKALELLDAVAARVKLRQEALPEEILDVQKRIRFIVHRLDSAVANHEFEKARFYSDEERKERENLSTLRKKYHLDEEASNIVRPGDVEEVILRWSEYPFQP